MAVGAVYSAIQVHVEPPKCADGAEESFCTIVRRDSQAGRVSKGSLTSARRENGESGMHQSRRVVMDSRVELNKLMLKERLRCDAKELER